MLPCLSLSLRHRWRHPLKARLLRHS
jgi:hypothetical protein